MERRARILLVDDDADFVESTKTVLESEAYDVVVAVNGDEGLRKARAERPDLITVDCDDYVIRFTFQDGFGRFNKIGIIINKQDPGFSFHLQAPP